MSQLFDFFLQFLSQFAGGPGPMENNLVRFGLPAVLWGALLVVAWTRQRHHDLPRERLLVWGFGLGFASAFLMATFVSLQMLDMIEREAAYAFLVPLDRALAMSSVVVVAGAFLRYILDDARLAYGYLGAGLGATAICLIIAFWQWPNYPAHFDGISFHAAWGAWLFHLASFLLILLAVALLRRKRDWLSNVVSVALLLFLASELLLLVNYATSRDHSAVLCPIGNSLRILAVPLLGYVYLREQSIEKRRAEKALEAHRLHLEDLVAERTAQLTTVNDQLQQEVVERAQAEKALEQLGRRYEQILESAGEGICGIDVQGRFVFVNSAAARMLGYRVEELIGHTCHPVWHHSQSDHSPYPEEECPICAGYTHGLASRGDDQRFWRKDGTSFPVQYVSSPAYEDGDLTGAVVVFRDITRRKQAEAEIAQRSANLAAQNAVAATLSRSLELDTILSAALDVVLSVVDMDVGLVFLWDPDAEGLVLQNRGGQLSQDEAQGSEREWNCCVAISTEAMTELRAVVHAASGYPGGHPKSNIVREGLEMLVSAPLVYKGKAVGALTLGSRRQDPVQQPELELLTAMGQQIGMAIENARLYRAAERSAEELALLHQVSLVLTSTLDATTIYDQIAEQAVKLLSCEMACVFAWHDEPEAELVASYGMSEAELEVMRAQMSASAPLQSLARHQQSVALADVRADSRIPPVLSERLDARALLCVPIWGEHAPVGSLFLIERRVVRDWRFEELELIESFVNRAAVALVNAGLHKQLEWAATLEERQRIAADMHDGLAQTVSLLGLRIDGALALVANGSAPQALQELSGIRETVEQVSVDVRRSIASLHETPRPRRSLQDLLSDLLDQFPGEDGPAIDLVSGIPEPVFLPLEQVDQVLPVVQEALWNARRHAHAQHITLQLDRRGQELMLTVKDDGRGFEPGAWWQDSRDHFGLSVMHARAARAGGSLEIDSAPGRGTRVVLSVPLDDGDRSPLRSRVTERRLPDLSRMGERI